MERTISLTRGFQKNHREVLTVDSMSNKKIKLSIIIPCYNSKDYIIQCLESIIPNMTSEMEIIIINDGSTDNSLKKIKGHLKNKSNINSTVINQENKGVSAARNLGIEIAAGEYITFIDADDIYKSDFWHEMIPLLDDKSIDIIEYDAEQFESVETNIVEYMDCSVFSGKVRIKETLQLSPSFKRCKWYPWARTFKRSLFIDNKIAFPQGKLYEDMLTIPKLYLKSKCIYGIQKPLVSYRFHSQSITQTFRQKDLSDLTWVANELSKIARESADVTKTLSPTILRIFNLIKYSLVRNKSASLSTQDQKKLRNALMVFSGNFNLSKRIKITLLPLYLNTIIRFRTK
jgi:glycosyltransferase involved in cell wall biosynthesis